MNFTADLVADALFNIEMIKDKVCRVYSTSREDIFNVNISELPEWSILHQMLFDTAQLDTYTRMHTTFQNTDSDEYDYSGFSKARSGFSTFNPERIDELSSE